MAKTVKVKTVVGYSWVCPGCSENNLDNEEELRKIHDDCNCDYLTVTCSNCSGSYIVSGSCGWLTKLRRMEGRSIKDVRVLVEADIELECRLCRDTGKPCDNCGEYHDKIVSCPVNRGRMRWVQSVCPGCGRSVNE